MTPPSALAPISRPSDRAVTESGIEEQTELDDRSIAIIIPAHNEAGAIGAVLENLKHAAPPEVTEIIVVDDGSTDETAAVAAAHGVQVIRHVTNRGYGASLKTGIRAASAAFVLTMDADGQHRIEDVLKLCERVRGDAVPDCLIGQRTALLHSPMWRMPGKWFLTHMAQFLAQRKIPDLNSGLRMLRRPIALRYLRLCPQGFSFSTTITMAMMSRGYGVQFVPIEVKKRIGKSTVNVKTGFQTILLVIRLATLFNPLRIFLPLSMLFFVVGLGWGIPHAIAREGLTTGAMMFLMTGFLMFALGLICDQVAQLRLERYE